MNKRLLANLFLGFGAITLSFICNPTSACAMTVSGPITVSSITATGDISVSSMTVSSMVVTNQLRLGGVLVSTSGLVLQMSHVSSTTTLTTSSTSWYLVPGMSSSISLSDSSNYVKVYVTGGLYIDADSSANGQRAYVTVFRDTTNLGDSSLGFTHAGNFSIPGTGMPGMTSAGISVSDSPGAGPHTYHVYIRTENSSYYAGFPNNSKGYLILEEISD